MMKSLEMECPQLRKPEVTAPRNPNSIGDRMEKTILGETRISLLQGSSNLSLEGQSAAEFSSNPDQTHLPVILKTLISMLRCVWLGLEMNSAGVFQIWGWLVYSYTCDYSRAVFIYYNNQKKTTHEQIQFSRLNVGLLQTPVNVPNWWNVFLSQCQWHSRKVRTICFIMCILLLV